MRIHNLNQYNYTNLSAEKRFYSGVSFGNRINMIAKPSVLSVSKNIGNELKTYANKLLIAASLPIVSVALTAPNWLGARNANIVNYKNQALHKLKEMYENGDLTQKEYNKKVSEFKTYYDNALKTDDRFTSHDIKEHEPSFKGQDSDVSKVDADDECCGMNDDSCSKDNDECCGVTDDDCNKSSSDSDECCGMTDDDCNKSSCNGDECCASDDGCCDSDGDSSSGNIIGCCLSC